MSAEAMEKERNAFEKWLTGYRKGMATDLSRDKNGIYLNFDFERQWWAWLARADMGAAA